MHAAPLIVPLLASDAPFIVLFSVFVVAIVVLIVLTIMWTIRRDRSLRAAWRQRQIDAGVEPYGIIPKGSSPDDAPSPGGK